VLLIGLNGGNPKPHFLFSEGEVEEKMVYKTSGGEGSELLSLGQFYQYGLCWNYKNHQYYRALARTTVKASLA
jgi:hypothetical protein